MADVTDDFNGASLDAAWTVLSGTPVVSGGAVNPNGVMIRTGETFDNDHFSQITIVEATEQGFCAIVRVTDANNFYYFYINGTTAQIFKLVGGSFAAVSSQAVGLSVAAGAVWKLEITGTSLKGYLNGVEVCSGTDSDLATGVPGIIDFQQSTATIDQWIGGPLAGGGFQAAWARNSNVMIGGGP
jgi:hypothetical protein